MEDEFGDDDAFDQVPDNAWDRLEQSAISSTQRPRSHGGVSATANQPRIHTYGATGLSRNTDASRNAWRPPQPVSRNAQAFSTTKLTQPPPSAPAPPSSDYGFDEEDVIDLDEPSMVVHSAPGLLSHGRGAAIAPLPARSAKAIADAETEAAFAAADAELGTHRPETWVQAAHPQSKGPVNANADLTALQARVAELEASNSRLQNSEQAALHAAQQKAGEIAIVRANHDRSSKEFERRIAVMQKLHADESAKQKAELETGRKEREKIETNNRFLQHDLAQEAERAKGLRGTGKARVAVASASGAGASTPRKDRRLGALGDGFDDDEVGPMPSPSKSRDKSRDHTPKVGTKRKRSAQDSPLPAPALSFSDAASPFREEVVDGFALEHSHLQTMPEDKQYDFIQKLLYHRPCEGAERTMEALTNTRFPTDSSRTISSILTDGLSSSGFTVKDKSPQRLAQIALRLWSRCLQEHFYEPIYLLLDLVDFAIKHESSSVIAQLVPDGVRACIKTIDLVAATASKALKYPTFAASEEYRKTLSETNQYIDADATMDLLQRICDAASLDTEACEGFWRNVELTFILQMLQKTQPLSQIVAALQMLCTSVRETSFGPIPPNLPLGIESEVDNAHKQTKHEKDLLDRLTSLLLEMPIAPTGESAYGDEEVQELRVEILHVFRSLCLTDYGSLLVAQHRSAIGRLVKFLEAQVSRLYSTRPSIGFERLSIAGEQETTLAQSLPHDLLTQSINDTISVLSHLLQSSTMPSINLQQKVSVIRGGWHKFLVSFTRIAFSDQLMLEAGVESDVVEAAHAILDMVLSPEEGEAVMRAVETPRGTKGSAIADLPARFGENGMVASQRVTVDEDPG